MEQAKRERGLCSGMIFWMMNDCWPSSAGWSLIDFYNVPKNAFYSFKRCGKHVIASIDHTENVYRVYVISDISEAEVNVSIKILSANRTQVREYKSLTCSLEKYSSLLVFEEENILSEGEVLICDIEGEFGRDRAFYRHGSLDIEPINVSIKIDEENGNVTLTAKEKYVHAVSISADAIFEDNCFSLLPYETRTVSYKRVDEGADIDICVEAYTLK